ncbi:hypothetical protein [Aquimarina macrocephali]|uniref:hypothetical protein n=1 Tax=Aquimarina macrocephali TaxID=666563 RepID=UPI0004639C19|nr:hypothetical protein [Aquimarina macrocephali]
MKENKIKVFLSYFFIGTHLLIIGYLFILKQKEYLSAEDFETAISILLPLFTTILAMVYKFIIGSKYKSLKKSKKVSFIYASISFFLPIIFVFVLFYLIRLQTIEPMENFGYALGFLETVIGINMGLMVKNLFENETQ